MSDEFEAEAAAAPPRLRTCLMCRTDFESAWAGERVCRRCKHGVRWRDGLWQSDDGGN